MNEFDIIRILTKNLKNPDPRLLLGAGDDCAVIRYSRKEHLLWTTDSLVENIHFRLDWPMNPHRLFTLLGWKALAVNVSDIVAMAGRPSAALVSLSWPGRIAPASLKMFYRGLKACAGKYGIALAGGNIARSRKEFAAHVSMIGYVKRSRLLLRSTARPGDHIYIQGFCGLASAGLWLLNRGRRDAAAGPVLAHLMPAPGLDWRRLMRKHRIRAAIDTSDGLIGDLGHIMKASRLGAEIFTDRLPVAPVLKKLFPENFMDRVLYGGEDYRILFTSQDIIREKGIARIGQMVPGSSLWLISRGKRIAVKKIRGFTHF